jgi:hypothetical protein
VKESINNWRQSVTGCEIIKWAYLKFC